MLSLVLPSASDIWIFNFFYNAHNLQHVLTIPIAIVDHKIIIQRGTKIPCPGQGENYNRNRKNLLGSSPPPPKKKKIK